LTIAAGPPGSLLAGFDASDFARFQRDIRAVDKATANALKREMRAGANILRKGLQASARENLGKFTSKGALNEGSAAAYGIKTSVKLSAVQVRWRPTRGARGFTQRAATNAGRIRHPLYGNRKYWYDTSTPSTRGWWDDAEEKYADKAADAVVDALDHALHTLGGLGI
jgi:hypothetical protein